MINSRAPRAIRASAARVVALAAAGGEWPLRWGSLVPSLLGQLALAAAASATARTREVGGEVTGDDGADVGGSAGQAGVENAVDRAESCITCLEYMTEEVRVNGCVVVGGCRGVGTTRLGVKTTRFSKPLPFVCICNLWMRGVVCPCPCPLAASRVHASYPTAIPSRHWLNIGFSCNLGGVHVQLLALTVY